MAGQDAFSRYHPAVNFLYFALVLVCAMFFMHPVCLAISFFSAVCYTLRLRGGSTLRAQGGFLLPMMLLAAVVNPLFNHAGVTVLGYLPGGNPLTLESILYGLAAAFMLAAVILWFGCYNAVVTSDKFICLFGRAIPALSLVISMALRFVPRFRAQFRATAEARQSIGRGISKGRLIDRLKNAVAILSITLTWSLENAVDTADSMKSRGYGLPGRSSFSIYRMEPRDQAALVWLSACGFYLLCGVGSGGLSCRHFPSVKVNSFTALNVSFFAVYLALCLTPVILDAAEDWLWWQGERGAAL